MNIKYRLLKVSMYEDLHRGWMNLPDNATGVGDDRKTIQKYLKRNKKCSYAAFDGIKMVGAILSGHDGRRGFLNHLFVVPEYRKNGIGNKLVELSINQLKKQGIERVAIFIHKSNVEAQLFWDKIGFEEIDFINTYGMNINC